MKLSNLTFIVTDDCNFRCTYCFQHKEKRYMDHALIEKAAEFFYPHFDPKGTVQIGFYGGEPLLAFPQIQRAHQLLTEKNKDADQPRDFNFFVTTNGSLLDEEKLEFFNRNHFALMLSFDGLAQEVGRQKLSAQETAALMNRIRRYPNIPFEINSVFTPGTVTMPADSIRFIVENNGPDISINLDTMSDWDPGHLETLENQLVKLEEYLLNLHRETGNIPVKNYKDTFDGIFQCSAGTKQMALTPEGNVWGCFLFHDFFKTRPDHKQREAYAYGSLEEFIDGFEEIYPRVTKNYAELRQNLYQVEGEFCFLCPDMQGCVICPVNAAYSSGSLGRITSNACKLTKLQKASFKRLGEKIEGKKVGK